MSVPVAPRITMFGSPGTGKTTLAAQIVGMLLAVNPGSQLILLARNPSSPRNAPLFAPLMPRVCYKSGALNQQTIDAIETRMNDPARNWLLIIFSDDMGKTSGMRSWVGNPLVTIATDAYHKNVALISCYQMISQPLPDLRKCTDIAYLFEMDQSDKEAFMKMFMSKAPEELRAKIVSMALQEPHDFLEVDKTDPYRTVMKRNAEWTLFPTEETGMRT